MIPTATVTKAPEMIGEEMTLRGLIRVRTYRMRISPSQDEPIKSFRENESFVFELPGNYSNTRDLVPGTPIHIAALQRNDEGELRGYGINLERYGCCDNCEREGTVQFTPENPNQSHCARCVANFVEYQEAPPSAVMTLDRAE